MSRKSLNRRSLVLRDELIGHIARLETKLRLEPHPKGHHGWGRRTAYDYAMSVAAVGNSRTIAKLVVEYRQRP